MIRQLTHSEIDQLLGRFMDGETTIEEERFQKATHSITYVNTAKESSIEKYKDFFGEDPKIDENNTISD